MHFVSKFWFRTTVVISVLILIGLGFIAWCAFQLGTPNKGFTEEIKIVDIPRGTRLVGIAEILQQAGIIHHRRAFIVAMAIERRKSVIRAGEYRFDRPLSEFQVIRKLLRGEVHYHQVTVPEGSNIFDIGDILENAGLAQKEEFVSAAYHTESIKDIAPDAVSLEGFLFPDTYKFEKQTPAAEIAGKMVERFRKFVTQEYLGAAQQENLTLYQAVILASLIEKETGKEDERPRVSAVFHNRLQIHQRLECDPTVIYAALVTDRYRGKIYRSDMQIDSPYNTYLQNGLPLGPIANPGRASLEAAVHPAQVDYLYFVSNNNGSHTFSKTLAQHQNAVREYRRAVAREAPLAPHDSRSRGSSSKSKRPSIHGATDR